MGTVLAERDAVVDVAVADVEVARSCSCSANGPKFARRDAAVEGEPAEDSHRELVVDIAAEEGVD